MEAFASVLDGVAVGLGVAVFFGVGFGVAVGLGVAVFFGVGVASGFFSCWAQPRIIAPSRISAKSKITFLFIVMEMYLEYIKIAIISCISSELVKENYINSDSSKTSIPRFDIANGLGLLS